MKRFSSILKQSVILIPATSFRNSFRYHNLKIWLLIWKSLLKHQKNNKLNSAR